MKCLLTAPVLLVLALAGCGFCLVVPAWRTQRDKAARLEAHARALEDSLGAVKAALTKLQIQHNVTQDDLLNCREAAAAREAADLRKLPSVEAAHRLLNTGGKTPAKGSHKP